MSYLYHTLALLLVLREKWFSANVQCLDDNPRVVDGENVDNQQANDHEIQLHVKSRTVMGVIYILNYVEKQFSLLWWEMFSTSV